MSCCDSFGYVLTVEAWLPYTSEFTNAIYVPNRTFSVRFGGMSGESCRSILGSYFAR